MTVRSVGELTLEKNKLIKKKLIEKAELITDDSFVVGKEFDMDGNLINPLIQFFTKFMGNTKSSLIDKKVGDVVELKEFNSKLEILEVYRRN